MHRLADVIKHTGDVAAGVTTLATLLKYAPAVAALYAIAYYNIRIIAWVYGRLKDKG